MLGSNILIERRTSHQVEKLLTGSLPKDIKKTAKMVPGSWIMGEVAIVEPSVGISDKTEARALS